ncbi:Cullin-4 [Diplonema papillatum]|nr:Cullin-4 [Diplonema papillatum]
MKARNKNNSTNNNNNAAKKSAAAVGDASTDGALEVLESPFGGADTSMALKRNTSSTASLKMTKANSIKLTIKPLTTPVALPADFEATLWKKLDAAVDAIFRAERAAHPQEELYRAVQDLCTNKMDNELYRKLEKKCNAHVESSLEQLQSSNTTGQQYLALVGKVWDTHCRETQTIKTVFGCLDRAVMLQGGTRMPLWELGVDAFRTHFSKREAVVQKVLDLFYAEVKAERNGTLCDRAVMKKLSNMFTVLSLYPKLEAGLLAGAKEFYTDEGNETARTEADKSCKDYLHLVERRLHEEADRVSAYLNLETKKPLITLVETHLVADV